MDGRTRVLSKYPHNSIHSKLTWVSAGNRFDLLTSTLRDLPADEVNWRDHQFGNTALHWAVANSNTRMALRLLDEAIDRIDFDTRDDSGKTVLHLALGKGYEHFTDNTREQTTHEPPQAPVIQRLIDEMGQRNLLNQKDDLGNTPLHIAMIRRDYLAVEMLLQAGAAQSLDTPNIKGQTPRTILESIDYAFAREFINKYVRVFTLTKETWYSNQYSLSLLLDKYPASGSDQYASPVQKKPLPYDESKAEPTPDSLNLLQQQFSLHLDKSKVKEEKHDPSPLKINAPVDIIFEQAISYLDSLTGPDTTDSLITPKMKKSAKDFQSAIRKLKKQSEHLSSAERLILAEETINLSMQTASLAVNQDDINHFYQATIGYRKTSKLGKVVGAVIGAAVGLFVGTLIGAASGPGAAFTALAAGVEGALIGASVGALVGSGLGFWATKKILDRTHSLMQINRAASKIACELK